jgi:tetratricopeptide (TPR) repeat protein
MAGNHTIYVVDDVPIFQGLVTPGDVNLDTFFMRLELMNKYDAAGQVDLAEAEKLREQIHNASQRERVALQARLASEAAEAMSEFQQALAETDENDAFFQRASVLGKIAESDDTVGKYGDPVKIYAQAVALKPDAILYDNFAKDLARCGQVGAAINAYKTSAELASTGNADVYLNLGITLYNANRLDQAIAPLRKAAEIDPQNARPWYLLGTALVGSAQRQQRNTKERFELLPGTIEAFQKAIELDPHGHYGKLAQDSLQELQRILQGSGHTLGPN